MPSLRRVTATAVLLLAAAFITWPPAPARAQALELSIGLSAAITSMDPHFHNLSPNNNVMKHIYKTLLAGWAATKAAIADVGLIPLYHQVGVWGMRRGLGYTARTDEATWAHEFRLEK